MSTKVYDAYKLIDSDLWDFAKDIHTKGTKSFKKHIKKYYLNRMNGIDLTHPKYSEKLISYSNNENLSNDQKDKLTRLGITHELLTKGYKEASASSCIELFDFDVNISFRELDDQVYLQTFEGAGSKGVLKFLKKDSRITDYHYQNQSDVPEEISEDEWEKRGKMWNKMDESGAWWQRLDLEICSYGSFWRLNPWLDISKEIYKESKNVKIINNKMERK